MKIGAYNSGEIRWVTIFWNLYLGVFLYGFRLRKLYLYAEGLELEGLPVCGHWLSRLKFYQLNSCGDPSCK